MKTFCIVAFILMLGARAFAADFCNAEERAYDKEHRELLNLPPGECVHAGTDFPTRAAGWLDAVQMQQRGTPYDEDAPLPCLPSPLVGIRTRALICAAVPDHLTGVVGVGIPEG
jgi:hypothetical protein